MRSGAGGSGRVGAVWTDERGGRVHCAMRGGGGRRGASRPWPRLTPPPPSRFVDAAPGFGPRRWCTGNFLDAFPRVGSSLWTLARPRSPLRWSRSSSLSLVDEETNPSEWADFCFLGIFRDKK